MANYFDLLRSPLLLLMRLYWGIGFMMAGKAKLFNLERTIGTFTDLGVPLANVSAVLVGTVECVGGALLVLGLFSRLAAIPLVVIMLGAYATVHKSSVQILFQHPDVALKEEPFLFLLTCLIVAAFGPGKLAVDTFLKKKYCEGPL